MCLCVHWSLYATTHWIRPPMAWEGSVIFQHTDDVYNLVALSQKSQITTNLAIITF